MYDYPESDGKADCLKHINFAVIALILVWDSGGTEESGDSIKVADYVVEPILQRRHCSYSPLNYRGALSYITEAVIYGAHAKTGVSNMGRMWPRMAMNEAQHDATS